MKKIIMGTALLAALSLVSCEKNETVIQPEPGTMADISFSINGVNSFTKSLENTGESNTDKVEIGVYNPDGFLIARGLCSNGSLELRVPVGLSGYDVYALVNSPNTFETCLEKKDIANLTSNLGSNVKGKKNALEMFGELKNTSFAVGKTCKVPVKRFAAKVELDKIVNATTTKVKIEIDSIYLVNVNTACKIDYTVSTPEWHQKMTLDKTDSICCYTAEKYQKEISADSSDGTAHYFYCYPNSTTTDSQSGTWSARYTRLVVSAKFNGTKYYYPINIIDSNKVLKSNTYYKISSLTITGPGSTSPDAPISLSNASFSFEIEDWSEGFSQAVTY